MSLLPGGARARPPGRPTSGGPPDGIGLAPGREERRVRVEELIRHLEDDGWLEIRRTAEGRQLTHARRPGLLTLMGDIKLDIPTGTLRSVLVPTSHPDRDRT